GSYGLETLQVIGSGARFVLREACESLEFYPRISQEVEIYKHLGGMMVWSETFNTRIARWLEQSLEGASPEAIDGSGAEALKAQLVIEAAIESWNTGTVVTL